MKNNPADKEFVNSLVTRYFTEFKPLLAAHKTAKNKVRTAHKKLITFEKKYQFLIDMVKEGARDDFLADKIKLLLKSAGFTQVNHYINKLPKREDLQAYHDNDLFIIEVKGLSTGNPKRTDLIQVAPYYQTTKTRQPTKNVYGLSIISHQNNVPIKQRGYSFFDKEKDEDLKSYNVGVISVIGLLIYFKKLKTGKINFEEFKNTLKGTGYIKYW